MPGHIREEFEAECQYLREQVQRAKRANRKIIFLDEINFTKQSVLLREWSQKNSNLAIDQ